MIDTTNSTYATDVAHSTGVSATSWGAIIAGAIAATALSWILLLLGSGLGFAAVSPWANEGVEPTTLGLVGIIWILLTHIIASGMGGYLAGRLRVMWSGTHTDEVYFRDTAHGFLTWAVAVIITALMVGSAITSTVAAAGKAGTSLLGSLGTATAAAGPAIADEVSQSDFNPLDYFTDRLFRSEQPATSAEQRRTEAVAILANSLRTGELTTADRQYLGGVVAQNTGLNRAEAERRVSTIYNEAKQAADDAALQAKEAADAAASVASHAALWTFIALLCGAFAASFSATLGGRQRDSSVAVRRHIAN